MRQTSPRAPRQGHRRGQDPRLAELAARFRVSADFLRLIATGSLQDPIFCGALRRAARRPELWDLVSGSVREYLAPRERTMVRIGGTLDDLLRMYVQSHGQLRHPVNRNYARRHGVLKHVDDSLEIHLEDHKHREREKSDELRRAVDARSAQARTAARKQVSVGDERRRKVEASKGKSRAYDEIAAAAGIQPESVRKSVSRARKKARQSIPTKN